MLEVAVMLLLGGVISALVFFVLSHDPGTQLLDFSLLN